MDEQKRPPESRTRIEPEIIPPGRPDREARSGAAWTRLVVDEAGVRRVSVTRIEPRGMLGFWAIVALGSLALVVVLLGALVLLIPVAAALLIAGFVRSMVRSSVRRWF